MVKYFLWHIDELLGRVLSEQILRSDKKAEIYGAPRDPTSLNPPAGTHPDPNPLPARVTAVDASDPAAVRSAALASDVVVYPSFGETDGAQGCEELCAVLREDAELARDGSGSLASAGSAAGPSGTAAGGDGAKGAQPKRRTFVCVSTVLTWARTRSADDEGDDEDGDGGDGGGGGGGGDFVLTEDDFRRRRAHPSFRHHLAAEKAVARMRVKGHLRTVVVSAGLVYGRGEWMLHPWFRDAWSLRGQSLDCYGRGENVVPTVHVEDLAGVILAACAPEATARYLLAVDESDNTLAEICGAVNRELGTGRPIGHLKQDEVLLLRDIELFLVNLRMEATAARDLGYEWRYPEGLVERVGDVVTDFRTRRGLTPVKLLVHGPPASGKSHYAAELARHYHIHHLRTEDVLAEYLAQCDDDARAEADEAREENGGRYPDDWMARVFRGKLRQRGCANQGYVLDGFPKTAEQCALVFPDDPDDAAETGDTAWDAGGLDPDADVQARPPIRPDHVLCLDAPDAFLADRVMALPEDAVRGTHNDEHGFRRRLAEHRRRSSAASLAGGSLLDFFEERGTDPLTCDVADPPSSAALVARACVAIGRPHNYGPSAEELAEVRRRRREEEDARHEARRVEQEAVEAEERGRRRARDDKERRRLEAIQQHERDNLDVHALPLRGYLLNNVIPTVTEALIEICKVRPDDPAEYLATYLFRASPDQE